MRNDINPHPQHPKGIYRIRLAEYIATQPPSYGGCVISQIPWGFISPRRFGKRRILGASFCVLCTTPSTRRNRSLPISPLGGGYHHDCKSCISSVPLDCISSRLAVHITDIRRNITLPLGRISLLPGKNITCSNVLVTARSFRFPPLSNCRLGNLPRTRCR